MTINDVEFSIKIQRLQVNPNHDTQENVVTRVSWQLVAKYVDPVTGQEHIATYDDTTTIKLVDAAGYIPFENLSESDIISWVEARENQRTRNIDWRKQNVFKLLQEKIVPTNVTVHEDVLPWVQQ
jgi:hypothetical protein